MSQRADDHARPIITQPNQPGRLAQRDARLCDRSRANLRYHNRRLIINEIYAL
jgi:hypothetical protein